MAKPKRRARRPKVADLSVITEAAWRFVLADNEPQVLHAVECLRSRGSPVCDCRIAVIGDGVLKYTPHIRAQA